ncbi:MAG: protein-glutamate O-methyltransferase CheR [Actinomycetia bacterium]|nr:protein-glutamate O-methyltransferase CheR [Actinomycetes bacterium]MCP4959065.1 protein-glutamate O-methyltransferase CheR [Actinomycetes bacterium]
MTVKVDASTTMSARDLEFIERLVSSKIGVQLDGKAYLIESRLTPLCRRFDVPEIGSLVSKMRRGDRQIENAVIDAMTTNETSFFRDQHPFESLATHVIPDLVKKRGASSGISIWNAACSSGQESYTLALQLFERFPSIAKSSQTKILSTDVSPEMVQRTKMGEYSRFEVNRGLSTGLAMKYFVQDGRQWQAKPEVRALVDTREFNLLESMSALPRMDLVLVRNVLIYFPREVKRSILERIRTQVLKPDGWLMLGASESTLGTDDGFESRRLGESTFFCARGAG